MNVVSSLTVFELCLRDNNIEPVKDFLDNVEIIQFGGFESMLAAELHKQLKRKGKICQINDVFIAATAITNNCALATLNKKHFKNINGLKII